MPVTGGLPFTSSEPSLAVDHERLDATHRPLDSVVDQQGRCRLRRRFTLGVQPLAEITRATQRLGELQPVGLEELDPMELIGVEVQHLLGCVVAVGHDHIMRMGV